MEETNIIRRSTSVLFKTIIASSILFGSMYGFYYYKKEPIVSFCNNLPITATPDDVLSLAKASGLPVFNVMEARNTIVVLNQKSPFFRFSCNVEFNGAEQVNKHVSAAD